MLLATITAGIEELKKAYGDRVRVAPDGTRTLVSICDVELFPGCRPPSTDILLVLDPGQPKPLHYVREGQTLSDGRPPKNASVQLVSGESWMTFSFNFLYTEGDSLRRYVAMIRLRFSKHE